MFGYGFDRRILYGVLIAFVIYDIMSMSRGDWISILLTLPAVIIAITIHEFSHAKAADMLGDRTPRAQERLTLNPLKHLDPVGFVLLMFAHIGWGKPVEINPNNFTSNKSRGYCEAIVALAGPISNLVLAFILILIARLISIFAPNFGYGFYDGLLLLLIDITITINIGLGIFNLIPLPPLDGEKIFRNILPYRAQEWLNRNNYILNIIFIVLWITGTLSIVVSPIITVIKKVMVNLVYFLTYLL